MRLWETACWGSLNWIPKSTGTNTVQQSSRRQAMEQVAREVAGQDLTVNIPRPRHRMLFLLLSILVLCTAPCASSARKRRKTPCTAGFNPSILRNATPSRSWIPPPTPWSFPWGKPRVRTQTGGFHQVPPGNRPLRFREQGAPADDSGGRRLQGTHSPSPAGGQA